LQFHLTWYIKGTNTYLVGTGKIRVLIDTGDGKLAWIASLKDTLQKENATVGQAVITHWHHDHVGGIKQLLEFSPSTIIYKHQPSEGQQDIEDGQQFKVEGASLHTIYSPGHTQDHMALVLENEDSMFTGDNVLGHGTAVFEDLHAYIKSLHRMKGAFEGRAYPGHGPVIDDGPNKIADYIKHRQMREDQVIQVLKSARAVEGDNDANPTDRKEWTSMDIVKIIYKDVPENLHLPANGGITQILLKLEEEDKVIENLITGGWRLKNRAAL
jgi:ribonuclease/clavin/mitogillin